MFCCRSPLPPAPSFVPNGGRLYYTERSQPPLLSDMVCEVYAARPDRRFLARALPSLVRGWASWVEAQGDRTGIYRYLQ